MKDQAKFGFTFGRRKVPTMPNANTAPKALEAVKNMERLTCESICLPNMGFSCNKNEKYVFP